MITPAGEEPSYAVRSPRSDIPARARTALADRPTDAARLRVVVLRTMPPGSGLEPIAEALEHRLAQAGPSIEATGRLRRQFVMDDPQERAELAAEADAVILVAGPGATSVTLSLQYAVELERSGVPTVTTVFTPLVETARHVCDRAATPLRWVAAPPATEPDAAAEAADRAIAELTRPLSAEETATGIRPARREPEIAVRGTLRDIDDAFLTRGWSDGLPITPPTRAAVEEMLTGTTRGRDEIVTTRFRPEGLPATVENVAINAVLAGARPAQLPAILAAASMMGDQAFESQTRSVNSFAWAQLISGPYAAAAGLHGGLNALGPGHRANATIGRALHLMIRNLGHAVDGVTTSVTQGTPAGWGFAFTENTAQSPWEPFHVSEGFAPDESTSSLFTMGFAHDGTFYYGDLDDIARSLASLADLPAGALVLLSAKRARALADAGMSKQDVEGHLYRHAVAPLGRLRSSGFWPATRARMELGLPRTLPRDYLVRPDDEEVPVYAPGSIKVAVVGGDVASVAQAWVLALHDTASVDAWR
ncbi:hypothetical protein IC744_01090 [Microbacterium hominis]|uniref:UGSC family (seleno)protein n=1 Tax=Microbacterium TaxID=33882 RepID=UPI00168A403B|nr:MULTISPECIES: hypothetical protein [Microbacterium]QOC25029.1 hypothetical protein IC745_11735 [Microbacterium hominis]QOC29075.1 hypothetical protein IC744_01090 [Microbacterium hominis]QYF98710.1 hypothetical protein KY498_05660 [Microbacterium sp. PAMC21962]